MRIISYAAYLAARALFGFLGICPRYLVYRFASLLGALGYRMDGRHRAIALANLEQAFPEKSEEERKRIAKKAFRNFLCTLLEIPMMHRALKKNRLAECVTFSGQEELRARFGERNGMIFIAPHLGNWEVGGMFVGLHGVPFKVIARPLKNPYLDRFLTEKRETGKTEVFPRRGGFRALVEALRKKEAVALLLDQNQRKRPIFVNFFGKKAATDRSAAFLALRFGAPVVVIAALREGEAFQFRFEYRRIEPQAWWKPSDENVLRLTEEIHRLTEDLIRLAPDQYFWLHDRYRTRPGADPSLVDPRRGVVENK